MSEASVQFVEMIREAAARLRQPRLETRLYCEQCGREERFFQRQDVRGDWEVYQCYGCGCDKSFRTR